MFQVEWTNCAGEALPTRGAVVTSSNTRGVSWVYDEDTVFIIPIHGKVLRPKGMRPFALSGVRIVGRLAAESLAKVRNAMARLREISLPFGEDRSLGADFGDDHLLLPAMNDGWQPMSLMDGTYWKFPSRSGGH